MVDTGRFHYPENRRGPVAGPVRPRPIWSCSLHGEFIALGAAAPICPDCRRARETYNRDRRAAVRNPPRPPFENVAGICSLCGGPLSGRRRSWCSDECVKVWEWATIPRAAITHLRALHGDGCWVCGLTEEPIRENHYTANPGPVIEADSGGPVMVPITLELEHTRPLWSLTDEERSELRWWLPFNLALLCVRCHRAKTKEESAERARLRREATGQGSLV